MSNFKLTLLLSFCSFFVLGQETSLVILGTAQDAGSPQIACQKSCCKSLWESGKKEGVVSLGLIDSMNQTHFLFEATPDITQQLQSLKTEVGSIVKSLLLRRKSSFLLCLVAGDKRCSLNKIKVTPI